MADQGWEEADYRCGRCGTRVQVSTEADYMRLVGGHLKTHQENPQSYTDQPPNLVP